MSLRPRLTRDAGDGGAAWDAERAAAQENGAPFSAMQGASRAADAQNSFTRDADYATSTPFSATQGVPHAADAQNSFTQEADYAANAPFSAELDSVHTTAAQQPTPTEAPPILRHSVETYATERPSELYGHRRVVRDGRMPATSEKSSSAPSAPHSAERYGIPDNPFAPQGEGQPRRRSRVARAQNAEASAAQPAAPTPSSLAREQGLPPRAPWSGAGAASHAPNDAFHVNRSQTTSSQAPARQFAPSGSANPTNFQTFAPQVYPRTVGASAPADAPGASFAPPQSPQSSASAPAQVFITQDGSQFEAPVRPEVPDWLRVAQQNNHPLHRPQGPRVTAATRQSDDDEAVQRDPLRRSLHRVARHADASASQSAASYPADNAAPQRGPLGRPLHHAARHADASGSPSPADHLSPDSLRERARSYAESPADAPQASSQADDSPPAPFQRAARPRPASDKPHSPTRRPHLVWMIVAVFLAAAVAVGLWLTQLSFKGQTQGVLDARQAAYDAVVEAHPLRYQSLIEEKAGKYNLSPAFVAAIVLNESSFRPDATSSVGARGLMQLVDKTASWVHDKLELSTPYSFDALYEPETNVEYGCWYLSFLCNRFRGDPILVAAAYHAGQGEVQNWLNDSRYSADNLTIELENMMDGPTKQYTARVVSDYAVYKRLYYPSTEDSP